MSGPLLLPIDEALDADRDLIGGKAYSLSRMVALGLPVPPACVVPTSVCDAYYGDEGKAVVGRVLAALPAGIEWIEDQLDRKFGSDAHPLLVSVRSGAPTSMPGMMDTILNLGIDAGVERALARESGNAGWAAALHRRLRAELGALPGLEQGPPDSPWDQLEVAIRAVLDSWHSPRAIAYRSHHGIAARPGTAITIQAMVFGNLDGHSGTGVCFTRNPLDGQAALYGEWLAQSQGEDLVSGGVTPADLTELRASLPEAYAGLSTAAAILERGMADMQDVEFTVQSGRLYLLQSRAGKRSAEAALRIATELAEEDVITVDEALRRVTPEIATDVVGGSGPTSGTVLARGSAASPGVARGTVVFDADEAERRAGDGEAIVLARPTTNPTDLHGMIAAKAVITEIGGATSHAALVARDLGKPCVVGCGAGAFDGLAEEVVLVDGARGTVLDGDSTVAESRNLVTPQERELSEWAQERASIVVLDHTTAASDAGALEIEGELEPALREALANGVRSVVADHRLPALLTLLKIEREEALDARATR
jgi:pyruvate,orthophosphate dikinase